MADRVISAAYRGLLPKDMVEVVARKRLGFKQAAGTGALFHMISALSKYGKFGMTCGADSPVDAQAVFESIVFALDDEIGGHEPAIQSQLGYWMNGSNPAW